MSIEPREVELFRSYYSSLMYKVRHPVGCKDRSSVEVPSWVLLGALLAPRLAFCVHRQKRQCRPICLST